jgi:hypothetical protein
MGKTFERRNGSRGKKHAGHRKPETRGRLSVNLNNFIGEIRWVGGPHGRKRLVA